jgi:hypothetical protein
MGLSRDFNNIDSSLILFFLVGSTFKNPKIYDIYN